MFTVAFSSRSSSVFILSKWFKSSYPILETWFHIVRERHPPKILSLLPLFCASIWPESLCRYTLFCILGPKGPNCHNCAITPRGFETEIVSYILLDGYTPGCAGPIFKVKPSVQLGPIFSYDWAQNEVSSYREPIKMGPLRGPILIGSGPELIRLC